LTALHPGPSVDVTIRLVVRLGAHALDEEAS